MLNPRRSDYDVTNTVQVSSPDAVRLAVAQLFAEAWPRTPFEPVERSFLRFEEMFSGRSPGYEGVDTLYHDMQHTLDITLAMARLMAGYERQVEAAERFGGERAIVGLVTALFHDVGYLRERSDEEAQNGAEYTRTHVSRGARFLGQWLPEIGFAHWVPMAIELIHYTGYEKPIAKIALDDPRDRKLGQLLGTADMTAQMADRCYLEKCRDRLYPEFVLGGVALPTSAEGYRKVIYASGLDLLRQTPVFMEQVRAKRLDGEFEGAYRYLEVLFNGRNPYIEAIERNLVFLKEVLRSESWRMLRRNPPVFAAVPDPVGTMRGLMAGYIRKVWTED
ncbi:MAG: HD domain-containing protein [Steroidobacteraceae bacterium]